MPLTEETPKPMLPVGGKPMLEHIVENLSSSGIRNVAITTHYRAEKIVDHFQDGGRFGVDVSYVHESQPLGTAGALGLMDKPHAPLLVMNGDILTNLNFRALLEFHRTHHAEMTVCVRQYEVSVPYGVVEGTDELVERIVEKPTLRFFVNAGVYVLEPQVHAMIPPGVKFDMPQLVEMLTSEGRRVANFPILEYWLDIGQHGDYAEAQVVAKSGRLDEGH
ncbi:MAG: NTP transferase domain-containing protein, partial [Fimbriimonadaceae bacterium]|nr:NTP transferase domain-containing protein [Fimbriimonadaceae bacterium]